MSDPWGGSFGGAWGDSFETSSGPGMGGLVTFGGDLVTFGGELVGFGPFTPDIIYPGTGGSMTNITQIIVSRIQAPIPNALQKIGAFISQGSTTLTPGTKALLTQLSDLAPLLAAGKAITSMVLSAGTVTVTTTAPHGFVISSKQILTIAGVTPAAYNGTYEASITGASTFTFALAGSPGSVTVQGTYTNAELVQMNSTFFANGSNQAVSVLELGAGTPAAGVTAWLAYEALHTTSIYSNLVPRGWADEPTFVTLCNQYNANNAMKYFFVTCNTTNNASFTDQMKCVLAKIEAPGANLVEFTQAAEFYTTLNYDPNVANKVTPLAFSYQLGVTAFEPTAPQIVSFKATNLDYITTGAEGGIANTILALGKNKDGRPFNYWYSIDWNIINLDLNVTNEVINGSNNPQAPLYYDQPGIDRLQARCLKVGTQAINFGLALGSIISTQLSAQEFIQAVNRGDFAGNYVVNAVPFTSYTSLNPSHYRIGEYDGLMIAFVPARGFEHIIINLSVSDFVSA